MLVGGNTGPYISAMPDAPGEPLPTAPDGASEGPGRKGRLHATAVASLRRMILSGELAPGERLRELRLCTQLGVSRTPVREAVRTLAAEGLVRLLPNRSSVVAGPDPADVVHLFTVFGTLEGLAGELACRNITDAQLAAIATMQHEMVLLHQQGARAEYLAHNHAIHRAVVEAAANPVLQATWEGLLPRVHQARAVANRDPARWMQAVYEHASIFAALAARDGALLSRLMREHFTNGLASISRAVAAATLEDDAA